MTSFTDRSLTDDLPDSLRIFELAKWLDVPAGDLLRRVQTYDLAAGTVLTSIDWAVIRNVLLDYRDETSGLGSDPDPDLVEQLLTALEDSEHLGKNPVTAWRPSDGGWSGGNRFHNAVDRDPTPGGQSDEGPAESHYQERTLEAQTRKDSEFHTWKDEHRAQTDEEHVGEGGGQPEDETERARSEHLPPESTTPDHDPAWGTEDRSPADHEQEDYGPRIDETNGLLVGTEQRAAQAGDDRGDEASETGPEERRAQPDAHAASEGERGPQAGLVEADDEDRDQEPDPRPLGPVTPVPFLEMIEQKRGEVDAQGSALEISTITPSDVDDGAPSGDESHLSGSDLADLEFQSSGYARLRDRVVAGPEPRRTKKVEEKTKERSNRSRWYRLLTAAAIVLGTTVFVVSYSLLSPMYSAESDVVAAISGLGGEEIQRELQSLSVLAESQTVLAPVAEEFDLSVTDIRELFDSTIVGDSTVLRFTVTDGSPDVALAINQAIVASYLDVANQPIDQDELAFVQAQITATQESLDEIDAGLTQLEAEEATNNSLRLQVETERNVALAQLSALQDRLVDLRASATAPPGSINFVQTQVNEAEARLDELVAEAQAIEEADASTRSAADRLRTERDVLRTELADLEQLEVDLELDQISGTRVAVMAAGHVVDEPVGLTPVRAAALGLLVGGAIAVAWLFLSTQLRRKR